jgi:hypothetical protein
MVTFYLMQLVEYNSLRNLIKFENIVCQRQQVSMNTRAYPEIACTLLVLHIEMLIEKHNC